MSDFYQLIGKRLAFSLDAERAHGASIAALKAGLHPTFDPASDTRLAVDIAGHRFSNPLGMAAGYDKQGDVPDALLAMGFGHTEVGTITPKPQPGNQKPRVFRLVRDDAVINRLGFNSHGHAAALKRLEARDASGKKGIVGINIGANKTSEDFAADYVSGIHAFAHLADYFTVNVSSPNTPGLRALQSADPLADLLSRVQQARDEAAEQTGRFVPYFLKIAPDLENADLDAIAKALERSAEGNGIGGLIVSNTTLSRTGLLSSNSDESGGLSGKPLFERSTIVLARMFERVGSSMPLIGVGGVYDADTAWAKIEAGASLVQLYTGMIYQGPGLPGQILRGLSRKMDDEKKTALERIVGRNASVWASKKLPD